MFIVVFNIFKSVWFARFFEPLSSQGSCIKKIDINLRYNDKINRLSTIKINELLILLRTFDVESVRIEAWYVTQEEFEILTNIEDIKWI